jgi:hypothetical protein
MQKGIKCLGIEPCENVAGGAGQGHREKNGVLRQPMCKNSGAGRMSCRPDVVISGAVRRLSQTFQGPAARRGDACVPARPAKDGLSTTRVEPRKR